MQKKYYDLFDLLESDCEAEDYFCELPEYAREIIEDRADKIKTFDELRQNAENLL